ncbi:MAG: DUF4299 family protein [Bacteroidales bacterium]|nr:DUF4299 family protein [Bacteroidales bacterium]
MSELMVKNIWNEAYQAQPRVYEKQYGSVMGAFALTEATKTILPKNPAAIYQVDGQSIEEWNIALVSTTKDSIIATSEYYRLQPALKKYVLDEDENHLLIKDLSFEEIKELAGNC